ncbi:MAG: helix-turn-helix domain-containing protein [Polaribacter sp.]
MSKIKYVSKKPACACAVGLDLLGDRWSLIIIRDLFKGYNTYTDFLKKSSEGIATNILNDRLKKLVALGIIDFIKKESDRKVKEYFLTDKGIDLYPLIYELQNWSLKHVKFNHTDRTSNWKNFNESTTPDEVINYYVNSYKKIRFEHFGF